MLGQRLAQRNSNIFVTQTLLTELLAHMLS